MRQIRMERIGIFLWVGDIVPCFQSDYNWRQFGYFYRYDHEGD